MFPTTNIDVQTYLICVNKILHVFETRKKKDGMCSMVKIDILNQVEGLGFHDIQRFYIVLLAKIFWRMLRFSESLLARVLHGKYCHSLFFMDNIISDTSSHGWTEIIIGRNHLSKHLGLAIGNGESMNI